jgi:hypothetical protein
MFLTSQRSDGRPTRQLFGGKFDIKTLTNDVEKAFGNGCQFYTAAFPQENYSSSMQQFSKEIIPEFASQKLL